MSSPVIARRGSLGVLYMHGQQAEDVGDDISLPPLSPILQTKVQLFEILRSLEAVPGVQIDTGADSKTSTALGMPDEDEDMDDVDHRPSGEPALPRVDDSSPTCKHGVSMVSLRNTFVFPCQLSALN